MTSCSSRVGTAADQVLTDAALWSAAVAEEVAAATNPKPLGALKVCGVTAGVTVKESVAGVPIVAPEVSRAVATADAAPDANVAA